MFKLRWLLTAAGITGAILNAAQQRLCFALWIAANVGWIIVNLRRRHWPEALLFTIYLATAVAGWLTWAP